MGQNQTSKKDLRNLTLNKDNLQVTTEEVTLDELVEEYSNRVGTLLPLLKSLKKNELFRVLMNQIAPKFLVGNKSKWDPKDDKEKAILFELTRCEDLRLALIELMYRKQNKKPEEEER